jgi:hypothetical protein
VIPGFTQRWWLRGWSDGGWCTTLFDLAQDGTRVWVHPAAVNTYSILLDHDAMCALSKAVSNRDELTLTGRHPAHGKRTLRLAPTSVAREGNWPQRPADCGYLGPMELVTQAAGQRLSIVYSQCRLLNLRDKLADITGRMREGR